MSNENAHQPTATPAHAIPPTVVDFNLRGAGVEKFDEQVAKGGQGHASVPVSADVVVAKPRKPPTIREYGRQVGLLWGVLLLMQLGVLTIYRLIAGMSWPDEFGFWYLFLLPSIQGVAAIFVALAAPQSVRWVLLLVVAIAPWLYMVNLGTPRFSEIYDLVPLSLLSVMPDGAGSTTKDPLVWFSMQFTVTNTEVPLFPVVALLLVCLAPSFAVAAARRYMPTRLSVPLFNILAIIGIATFYGAVPFVMGGSIEANLGKWFGTPMAMVLIALPLGLAVLHAIDTAVHSKTTALLLRRSVFGLMVGLFLYWSFAGTVHALQWFDKNPSGVRSSKSERIQDGAKAVSGVVRMRTTRVIDTPQQATVRCLGHTLALFVLVLATVGLVAGAITDWIVLAVTSTTDSAGLTASTEPLVLTTTAAAPPPLPVTVGQVGQVAPGDQGDHGGHWLVTDSGRRVPNTERMLPAPRPTAVDGPGTPS